mmetsp:Transcript_741/g.2059  ORF Transcript_741/g.2059 Transcript_741/m.2059 type:complete len:246 (-) Transcript_741:26-763(-)
MLKSRPTLEVESSDLIPHNRKYVVPSGNGGLQVTMTQRGDVEPSRTVTHNPVQHEIIKNFSQLLLKRDAHAGQGQDSSLTTNFLQEGPLEVGDCLPQGGDDNGGITQGETLHCTVQRQGVYGVWNPLTENIGSRICHELTRLQSPHHEARSAHEVLVSEVAQRTAVDPTPCRLRQNAPKRQKILLNFLHLNIADLTATNNGRDLRETAVGLHQEARSRRHMELRKREQEETDTLGVSGSDHDPKK